MYVLLMKVPPCSSADCEWRFLQEEMMFDTYKVVLDWQNAEGGCSAESCAYIQLHGKGGKTCVTDQAFMSSGLGTSIVIGFHWL
jgi:hypothetical protein